jgi:hypothetical protein
MPTNPRLLRPRAAASTGFNPRSISGLALWLDAADSASVTLNSGNVSEWRDKSGNSRHFAQSTAANQPAYVAAGRNGLPVLRSASNQHLRRESGGSVLQENMSFLGLTAHTIFIAWKPDSRKGQYLFWASGGGRRLSIDGPRIGTGPNGSMTVDSGTFINGRLGTDSAITVAAAHTFSFRRDGSSFESWGNGTSLGTATRASAEDLNATMTFGLFAGVNADGSITDGAFNVVANGDMYEVLHFSRALSIAERQAIERYIGGKWGITVA